MMMTLIIAFRHHCSCELEPMQSSFLMISSELQVLGNWRRSLRTFCLQDSLALGSTELTLILVDCFLAVFFLAMTFRTSIPWKLETFTQNFWSSVFFGAWFFRIFKSSMLRPFIRTSGLQSSFKHLIRSLIFRGWDCSSELPVQSLQMLLRQVFRTC